MMRKLFNALSQLHRGVLICGGFAAFMLFGALLLMLPISQTGTKEVSFLDALFMSVSIVSVTGMSMFDLKTDFTIFGQLVVLFLMQVGGLGIMTMMAMVGISRGRKIRLQERLLIRDSFNLQTPSGMVMLVRKIILMTLSIEFCAGTILAAYFFTQNGWIGIYRATGMRALPLRIAVWISWEMMLDSPEWQPIRWSVPLSVSRCFWEA